jgi:hypothetical protein
MAKQKTVKMPDGTLTMSLRHQFTREEILERSRQLAEATRKSASLTDDKKRVVKEYDSRIANEAQVVADLSEKITNGYEHRDTDCRVVYDDPSPGKKTIYRNDTNEKVESRDMNNDEKQLKLSLLNQAQGDGASSATVTTPGGKA